MVMLGSVVVLVKLMMSPWTDIMDVRWWEMSNINTVLPCDDKTKVVK